MPSTRNTQLSTPAHGPEPGAIFLSICTAPLRFHAGAAISARQAELDRLRGCGAQVSVDGHNESGWQPSEWLKSQWTTIEAKFETGEGLARWIAGFPQFGVKPVELGHGGIPEIWRDSSSIRVRVEMQVALTEQQLLAWGQPERLRGVIANPPTHHWLCVGLYGQVAAFEQLAPRLARLNIMTRLSESAADSARARMAVTAALGGLPAELTKFVLDGTLELFDTRPDGTMQFAVRDVLMPVDRGGLETDRTAKLVWRPDGSFSVITSFYRRGDLDDPLGDQEEDISDLDDLVWWLQELWRI